ncbi:MAG: GAF domain-containing sensor histidine kinase [Raineya sp.]|nr:GAF domain-containing sensor histidine kinase [Raineya sp.]
MNYIERLSPICFDLLVIASLMGDRFNTDMLIELYGKRENLDSLAEAIREGIVEQFTEKDQQYFRFKDEKVKEYFSENIANIHDDKVLRTIVGWQIELFNQAEKRIRRFTQKHEEGIKVLKHLLNHPVIVEGLWNDALPLITESLHTFIEADLISIWAYDEIQGVIQCIEMYEYETQRHIPIADIKANILHIQDFPTYFDVIKNENIIVANDALNNPATYELAEIYLKPMGVKSLLDVPFFMSGKLAGIICFEQFSLRIWQPDEIFFGVSIGTFLSLTYQSLQRKRSEKLLQDANEYLVKLNNEIIQQNEEIKAQAEIIREQNQELQAQNAAIQYLNKGLEDLVKQRTANLDAATAKLISINEELDTFFYHSAHDLRRPLTNILGLLELAKLQNPNQEMQEILHYINHTVLGMDAMLRKLISISAFNNQPIEKKYIDFQEIISESLNLLERLIEQKQVKIITEIEARLDFYAEREPIKAIIHNLIENALIFARPEGAWVRIEIAKQENELVICISDNGIGIPEQYHQKIFQMFFRASTLSQGNGLGLYIVRKAVERLQGTIQLQSEPEKGSAFYIRLPFIR